MTMLSTLFSSASSHYIPETTFNLNGDVWSMLKYMLDVGWQSLAYTYIVIKTYRISLLDLVLGSSAFVCTCHMLLPNSFYTGGYEEKH